MSFQAYLDTIKAKTGKTPDDREEAMKTRRVLRTVFATVGLFAMTACNSDNGNAVVNPTPTGTITLNLTPSSVSASAGGTGSVGMTVTRGGGYDGAVLLTAAGVPAGVTLTFGSSTVPAGVFSTSVNISVAGGTPAATSSVTIVGTGGGLTSPAVTLTLRTL
jgi:hypothetical protein